MFKNYESLLFAILNIKLIFNHWKTECNSGSFLCVCREQICGITHKCDT